MSAALGVWRAGSLNLRILPHPAMFFICSKMTRYKDGLAIPDCVFEAAAWRYQVEIRCRCGHLARHDPHGLWFFCEKRRWNDSFYDLKNRFFCIQCLMLARGKIRPQKIVGSEEPATIKLPWPPEHEWKKAIARFRS